MTSSGRPVRAWTWDDTRSLHARALVWMLLVTLPLASVAGAGVAGTVWPGTISVDGPWWSAVGGLVAWAALVDGVSLVPVLVVALVTLPVTHVVGRLLVGRGGTLLQAGVSGALAGAMAAVPVPFAGIGGLVVTAPVSVAAGAAGALARWRQLRRPPEPAVPTAERAVSERDDVGRSGT